MFKPQQCTDIFVGTFLSIGEKEKNDILHVGFKYQFFNREILFIYFSSLSSQPISLSVIIYLDKWTGIGRKRHFPILQVSEIKPFITAEVNIKRILANQLSHRRKDNLVNN